ncbi:MAG: hypothetical protein N2646_02715 [Bellilinea sp.]|nr:hypothetical protein [Bellilinea sp.]
MQRRLALHGLWVEPASAAGLAGLALEINQNRLNPKGKRIVAVCTGHGLKDPDIIVRQFSSPKIVKPELSHLEEILLGEVKHE